MAKRKTKLTPSRFDLPLDRDSAREFVMQHINRAAPLEERNTVLDEQTIEKEYGWVFFYQSKAFLETGDKALRLYGSTAMLVEKDTGAFHEFGAGRSVESQIAHFEQRRGEEKEK
jgi:hypothetical protein